MPKRRRIRLPNVSDAELALLKELWDEGPATPGELHERLNARGQERAYTTVQTLLHRLFDKGWVTRRAEGQARRYSAKRGREELLAGQLDELADRVCDGMASPLMQTLVRGGLKASEIEELRGLLDEAEGRASAKPAKTPRSKRR